MKAGMDCLRASQSGLRQLDKGLLAQPLDSALREAAPPIHFFIICVNLRLLCPLGASAVKFFFSSIFDSSSSLPTFDLRPSTFDLHLGLIETQRPGGR